MTKILYGAPAAEKLLKEAAENIKSLKESGPCPGLKILRGGTDAACLSYEKSIAALAGRIGLPCEIISQEGVPTRENYIERLSMLAEDPEAAGILPLRPLPEGISEEDIAKLLPPMKDVDGFLAESSFFPCAAEAVIRLLEYYDIKITGKTAAVIGKGVGGAAARLLEKAGATVTICDSKTENIKDITRTADIVLLCTGRAGRYGAEYFTEKTVVVDLGAGGNPKTGLPGGDGDAESLGGKVAALTPVPGGVGAVTTALLLLHTAKAALRAADEKPE